MGRLFHLDETSWARLEASRYLRNISLPSSEIHRSFKVTIHLRRLECTLVPGIHMFKTPTALVAGPVLA